MDNVHNNITPSLPNYLCITRGKQQIADDFFSQSWSMLGLVIWRLQLCHTWSGVIEIARSVWLARTACTGMQWLHIITDEVIWSYLSVSLIKVQSEDHSSFDVNCQPQKNNLKFSHSPVEFSISLQYTSIL